MNTWGRIRDREKPLRKNEREKRERERDKNGVLMMTKEGNYRKERNKRWRHRRGRSERGTKKEKTMNGTMAFRKHTAAGLFWNSGKKKKECRERVKNIASKYCDVIDWRALLSIQFVSVIWGVLSKAYDLFNLCNILGWFSTGMLLSPPPPPHLLICWFIFVFWILMDFEV